MAFTFNTTLAERIASLTPLAYYTLDETTGTTATDSSGNGNDGTYTGGVTLDQAPLAWSENASRAALFDGVDGYISLGSDFGAQLQGAPAVSVLFLIDPTALPPSGEEHALLYVPNNDTTGLYASVTETGAIKMFGRSETGEVQETTTTPTGFVSADQTTAVLLVWDYTGDELLAYKNGELFHSAGVTFTSNTYVHASNTKDSTLFSLPGDSTRHYDGTSDDVAVFDYALTAADAHDLAARVVQETYADTALALQPDHHYALDESSGTTATDGTSNGGDGTYTDGPALGAAAIVADASASIEIDGAGNDRVVIPNGVFSVEADWHVAAWIQPASYGEGGSGRIISQKQPGGAAGWHVLMDDDSGVSRFKVQNHASSSENATQSAARSIIGEAALLELDYEVATKTMEIRLDGVSLGTATYSQNFSDGTNDLVFGNDADALDRSYDGLIGPVTLLQRRLTPAQSEALHYRGTVAAAQAAVEYLIRGTHTLQGQPTAGLIAWALDAATGDKVAEAEADSGTGAYEMSFASADPVFVFFEPPDGYPPATVGPVTPKVSGV